MSEYYTGEYSPSRPTAPAQMMPQQQPQPHMQAPLQPMSTTESPASESPRAMSRPRQSMFPQSYMYDSTPWSFDFAEMLRRALKYLIEGLAVALVAYFILKDRFTVKEAVILGITAALTFAILDTFSPSVSLGMRFGTGFTLGSSLFGVAPGAMIPRI